MTEKIAKKERTERKRTEILETALKVFAREGYADTDVQVIADLAAVGKGTVYRHFGNKQDLFLATARQSQEMMGEYIANQVDPDQSTAKVLRQIAVACAHFFERHPAAVEILLQERATFRTQVFPTHLMYRAEKREEFEVYLQQGMERGELREVNVRDVARAFGDLLFGSVVNGCLEGEKGSLLHRVEQAFVIFWRGIAAPTKEGA